MTKQKEKMKKVFLGGTCNKSLWRDELIPKLTINFYNPIVLNWTEELKHKEIEERSSADYCLYVITSKMKGVYSIAEIIDDSNKRPERTVFCFSEIDGPFAPFILRSLKAVGEMAEKNGATWCKNFGEVAEVLK